MLYDSNGFKPYIYILIFITSMYHTHTHTHIYIYILIFITSMYHTHTHTHIYIYIFYWPYAKIRWISSFWEVFKVSGTVEAVFTVHVWPLTRTYLVSQTCPTLGFLAI
jgi:hypothetical protein